MGQASHESNAAETIEATIDTTIEAAIEATIDTTIEAAIEAPIDPTIDGCLGVPLSCGHFASTSPAGLRSLPNGLASAAGFSRLLLVGSASVVKHGWHLRMDFRH